MMSSCRNYECDLEAKALRWYGHFCGMQEDLWSKKLLT